jgi:putative component of toxin-antitoxin plasmid stabilization module
MIPQLEIRRYVTAAGKDIFGEWWMAGLKDVRTSAKLVARIDCLAAGNFSDCKSLRGGSFGLRIDWGRVIGFTMRRWAGALFCRFVPATSANSRPTSSAHWNI